MYNKHLIVIDFETTGLNVGRDYPIQAAAVVLHPDGTIEPQFVTDIAVPWFVRFTRDRHSKAHDVHGITWERLSGARTQLEATWQFDLVAQKFPKALLAGANVGFDYAMLKRLYSLAGQQSRFPFDYHTVDLTGIAEVTLGVHSLKRIAHELGIQTDQYQKHDALGDATLTAECFKRLLHMVHVNKIKSATAQVVAPLA